VMVVFNFSGGGVRSAAFAMSVLQQLDSLSHGTIMKKAVLISGASGGMLAAAYFRELARLKAAGVNVNLQNKKYVNDISKDLLNPIFSSMIARDLLSPAQKFSVGPYRYVKDRGYAFEQKLNDNTHGLLDKNIGFYHAAERDAHIPLMILNSVITRDLRKLMVCTQPLSFMMQATYTDSTSKISGPDAVDFATMFKNENPMNLRFLTALRMNATYPYILPNVWLPSSPVIDVVDAGLRDNYGQETSLRFAEAFDEWIKENTSGVLMIQIRDRSPGGWEYPYMSDDITDHATKPFLLLQHNWFKMMEYFQNDMLSYYAEHPARTVHKILFQYASDNTENKAALNFHLSKREKKDIRLSVNSFTNVQGFEHLKTLLHIN